MSFNFPLSLARLNLVKQTGLAFIITFSFFQTQVIGQNISTYAGGPDNDNIPATEMSLEPSDVATDTDGNLYIIDGISAHRLLKLDIVTGNISIVAGTGMGGFSGDGGPAKSAQLYYPTGVAVDLHRNIFVADRGNGRIRKIDQSTGIITTVAGNGVWGSGGDGGPAIDANFAIPEAVAVSNNGDLYISDQGNNKIRKVDAITGIVTTIAGTGSEGYAGDGGLAVNAVLNNPDGLAFDSNGDLFFCDNDNYMIRKIALSTTGVITRVAGTGSEGDTGDGGLAFNAKFKEPVGIAIDNNDNIFIADEYEHTIRMVSSATGIISRLAGRSSGGYNGRSGNATDIKLAYPEGVAVNAAGNIFIADRGNHFVRKVDLATSQISVAAGNATARYNTKDGLASNAHFFSLTALEIDRFGDIYVADNFNHQIYKIDAGTGTISIAAGLGLIGISNLGYWISDDGGLAPLMRLSNLLSVDTDQEGNLYFADQSMHLVRKVDVDTKRIHTIAGVGFNGYDNDTQARNAMLSYPNDVALDQTDHIYISDAGNNRILKVNPSDGTIRTIAGIRTRGFDGDGGLAIHAKLNNPNCIEIDSEGNVYISDHGNNRIRKINAATGIITTVAGNGVEGFSGDNGPAVNASLTVGDMVIDASDNLYIADISANRIRMIDPFGIITTVVGNGTKGFGGDGGPATDAMLSEPSGVAIDAGGNILITDRGNGKIRKVEYTRLSQAITFPVIETKTFGDEPFALSASASSAIPIRYKTSDPSIATISGNIVTIAGAGTVTITATQPGSTVYSAATPVERTLVISKASQTIDIWPLPGTVEYLEGNLIAYGFATSGLPVSFESSDESVATVSGDLVTIHGTGTITITAKQNGNSNYLPAAAVEQTLTVTPSAQTIEFESFRPVTYGESLVFPFAFATSSLPVSFESSDESVAIVSYDIIFIVGAGVTTITATQSGNTNYLEAIPVEQTLTVEKAPQTITFSELPPVEYGDNPFSLTAAASSGFPVSYQSSDVSVATVSGNLVTIVGVGTATITAQQNGDMNNAPATPVSQILAVEKASQIITFDALPSVEYGSNPITVSATASSGLDISYESSDELVATVSGNLVTIVGAGTATITAQQGGDSNHSPAIPVSQLLIVEKASQTITFDDLAPVEYGREPITITATASSGLGISYQSSDESVATVLGNVITIIAPGTATITAIQDGNENYQEAISVSRDLIISKIDQTITFRDLESKLISEELVTLEASSTSGLPIVYSSSNPGVAVIDGDIAIIVGAGVTTITAAQEGNNMYNKAIPALQDLIVNKLEQTITFNSLTQKLVSDRSFTLSATTSSGLPVTFSSSNREVATIQDNVVTLVAEGNTTITASQSGDDMYKSATAVDRLLVVRENVVSLDPMITALVPENGASGVDTRSDLILYFNEAVTLNKGDVKLKYNLNGFNFTKSQALTSGNTEIDQSVVIIRLDDKLPEMAKVAITLDPNTFHDIEGNAFSGIKSNTWSFLTDLNPVDLELASTIPAAGDKFVDPSTSLILSFNKNVKLNPGSLKLYNLNTNALIRNDLVNETNSLVAENVITITPSNVLPEGTELYVQLDPGMITDIQGNPLVNGLSGNDWNFVTRGLVTDVEGSVEHTLTINVTDDYLILSTMSPSFELISVCDILGRMIEFNPSPTRWLIRRIDGLIFINYRTGEGYHTFRYVVRN